MLSTERLQKIGFVTVIILILIIGGILLVNNSEVKTKVLSGRVKVGFILSSEKDDHGWSEAHYTAMQKTAEELDIEVVYEEKIPATMKVITTMEKLISEGCKIIICDSASFNEYVTMAARKHPDIYFYQASGSSQADNLCIYYGRIYQVMYLSGIVAGLQTETNEIGYVGSLKMPAVVRGINAFALGVRSVNKKAKVYVSWAHSGTGENAAREAAETLFSNYDIDIITTNVNTTAICEMAEEKGIWCIGNNMDNSEIFPNSFLTASVWNWDVFYTKAIKNCIDGKFTGQNYWGDIGSGIMDLAPLTENVKPGISEEVDKVKNKLIQGTFDVFYGHIRDNAGYTRIGAGESMTDKEMLNDFDWFVEGVEIND